LDRLLELTRVSLLAHLERKYRLSAVVKLLSLILELCNRAEAACRGRCMISIFKFMATAGRGNMGITHFFTFLLLPY